MVPSGGNMLMKDGRSDNTIIYLNVHGPSAVIVVAVLFERHCSIWENFLVIAPSGIRQVHICPLVELAQELSGHLRIVVSQSIF